MSDSLQDRVVRLLNGTAHALIDKVEGLAPETAMAQAIREIDQVINEVRIELGRIEANKHQLATRLGKLAGEHDELGAKAAMAVEEHRDDLAAACLERQTLIEDQLPVLQNNLESQRESGAECESYLRALIARKQEREALLTEFLAARQRDNSIEPSTFSTTDTSKRQGKVERAESAFDRIMARATGMNGLSTIGGDPAKLQEVADLQRNKRIEERLALLKHQQRKNSST